ncbi:hypothetical protein GBAR_LOCUS15180 [Geodia barretti]|uniref:Uncharacterized protein n=1 Tax=Geodia barretti TaxID=519541 RepID=A0AA35WRI6_GEOBA|nr:hypothetical protein GBAR_LOCUS15180 [Geodia barretti]
MWITTAALYLAIVVAVTSAQPAEEDADCGNLGFERRGRFRADLPVCGRSEDQCCSAEYLDDVQERLQERLQRFLRREFDDVVEEYQDEVDNLLLYFDRFFPRKLLQNLPSFETFADNPILRRILARLIDNLEIDEDDDEFDVGDFLETLIESLTRIEARLIGGGDDRVECIAEVLEGLVDRDAVSNMRGLLRQVRRGITALMKTGRFLEGQRNRLGEGGARVLERCVARFTEIAFCSRCTRRTPPLCFKTCDALVRGCYSPYYTAFNRRYSRLWDKIQEIVEVLNATVEAVGEIELINFREVVSEFRHGALIRT